MLTVLLTRHGHTDRSEPEQYLGQRVAALLTDRGRRDAGALASRLDGLSLDRVISSPLRRAVDTARILARDSGKPVETDERLTELDYGAWEGLTVDEIDRRFPGERDLYEANPAIHQVGGGESGLEVAGRLGPFVDDLLAWWSGQGGDLMCVVVGHSSVNRVFLAVVLGMPLDDYRRRFRQDWANLTVLRWSDIASGPMLLLGNDLGHVRGLRGGTWD